MEEPDDYVPEDINEYMEMFRNYSLKEKREIALEQLSLLADLTHQMCVEVGADNELLVTKDIQEAQENLASEDDFVEGVVVYASSIQNSLGDFIDVMTGILRKAAKEHFDSLTEGIIDRLTEEEFDRLLEGGFGRPAEEE